MQLLPITPNQMMSSKRIAEKTCKEHSNVLRDIRNMLDELGKSQDSILKPDEYQIVAAKNGMTGEILLNERLSLCLASGYSIPLRMLIIDDWAAMKTGEKELTRKELALMVLASEEEKERMALELYRANTKIELLSHTKKTYTSTEIAKEAGLKSAYQLNIWLHQRGIQFKQGDTWVMYSKYADKGYTEIKQQVLDNGTVIYTRYFTQAGREFVLTLLSNQNAA